MTRNIQVYFVFAFFCLSLFMFIAKIFTFMLRIGMIVSFFFVFFTSVKYWNIQIDEHII